MSKELNELGKHLELLNKRYKELVAKQIKETKASKVTLIYNLGKVDNEVVTADILGESEDKVDSATTLVLDKYVKDVNKVYGMKYMPPALLTIYNNKEEVAYRSQINVEPVVWNIRKDQLSKYKDAVNNHFGNKNK